MAREVWRKRWVSAAALGWLLAVTGCALHEQCPSLPPLFTLGRSPQLNALTIEKPSSPSTDAGPKVAKETEETLPAPRPLAPTAALTLDQAISECLAADPKIRAEWEAVEQARAELVTRSLPPNPSLYMDFQMLPLTVPWVPTRQGGPPQTDYTITYPIDWFLFGKRAAAIVSGKLGVEVAAAEFADQVRKRVTATIIVYLDVLEAEALLQVAHEDLETHRKLETIAKARVKDKKEASTDVNRVRTSIVDSERDVREREKVYRISMARLRSLMGRTTDSPLSTNPLADVNQPATAPSVEEALGIAEEIRPDLISLRRQIARADADVKMERARAHPPVAPMMGYTRQFQEKAIGFPDANSLVVAMTVEMPLFNRNQGGILKARSAVVQSHLRLQEQLLGLRAEVSEAVEEYRVAVANVQSIGPDELWNALEDRNQTVADYRVAKRPLIDALDAEKAYRDLVRQRRADLAAYWKALYRLNSAMGKQVLR